MKHIGKKIRKLGLMGLGLLGVIPVVPASAAGDSGGFSIDTVTIAASSETDAGTIMADIIGVLLTVMRYVGVGMTIWGVYSIVMSITQDRPEEKIKGIALALSGVIMIALKSVLKGIGVLG